MDAAAGIADQNLAVERHAVDHVNTSELSAAEVVGHVQSAVERDAAQGIGAIIVDDQRCRGRDSRTREGPARQAEGVTGLLGQCAYYRERSPGEGERIIHVETVDAVGTGGM